MICAAIFNLMGILLELLHTSMRVDIQLVELGERQNFTVEHGPSTEKVTPANDS